MMDPQESASLVHLALRHVPKLLLTLLVLGIVARRVLASPRAALGRARSMALTGIVLLAISTLLSPAAYLVLDARRAEAGMAGLAQWYGLVGGMFTLTELGGLLLLGLAVVAARRH